MPKPRPEPEPETDGPDRASALSRALMSQIDARLQQGVAAASQPPLYYVIRSKTTGLLSVIAASSLGDEQEPLGEPRAFADCIAYVNAQMVGRYAWGAPPAASDPEEPQ